MNRGTTGPNVERPASTLLLYADPSPTGITAVLLHGLPIARFHPAPALAVVATDSRIPDSPRRVITSTTVETPLGRATPVDAGQVQLDVAPGTQPTIVSAADAAPDAHSGTPIRLLLATRGVSVEPCPPTRPGPEQPITRVDITIDPAMLALVFSGALSLIAGSGPRPGPTTAATGNRP